MSHFYSESLADWLSYLEHLHPKSIDMGLDRVREVAQRLGLLSNWPALKIVVAGTNGKGSTCAMLEAIYMAAGYRVGLYTSPHILAFNERIRVQGELASDTDIVTQLARIESLRGDISLSYFEYTTLAAFLHFQSLALDVCILEVGLGGRLDAVNILSHDCAILTNIDIDHTQFLGNTREAIGLEKAHVFRPHKPAICSDPSPPASVVQYATQVQADYWQFGRDFNYQGDKQQWAFASRLGRKVALAYPALRGANQLLNASAALAAIDSLRAHLPVPVQAIREGLLRVQWPGRFQILPGQPCTILDVAHNAHAGAVLSHNLQHMGYFPYTYAVLGMLDDKDAAPFIRHFRNIVDAWYVCTLDGPRGRTASSLAECVRAHGMPTDGTVPIYCCDSPAQAYAMAKKACDNADRLVVFGSFLTVAGVLPLLKQ